MKPFFDFNVLINILHQKSDHYFDGFVSIVKVLLVVATFIMLIQMINISYVLSKRQLLNPTSINSPDNPDNANPKDADIIKSSYFVGNKTLDQITIPLQTAYNNLNMNYLMKSTYSKPF